MGVGKFIHGNASQLEDFLKKYKNYSNGGPPIAVFDADGTLWKGDIGDEFFRFQRENGLLKKAAVQFGDLQKTYEKLLAKGDTALAYGAMALWNEGHRESDLIKWSRECWQQIHPLPHFKSQIHLIHNLKDLGFEVWVVSASIWWVVCAGVESLGIGGDHVLASRTKVKNGILTGEFAYDVPYREGKVRVIEQFIKRQPTLVSGNSMGDYEMMKKASQMALIIHSAKPGSLYYQTELEVCEKARIEKEPPTWLILEEE